MDTPLLSVALIMKDEAGNLPALFDSLASLRKHISVQVVAVDTGSSDRSAELAGQAGAEVSRFTWTGDFSAARNASLAQCRGDWVLWLDADDRLPPATAGWLAAHLAKLPADSVYFFTVKSPSAGGGSNSFAQLRLFPRAAELYFSNPIHETLSHSLREKGLKTVALPLEVLHTGYEDGEKLAAKVRRNLAAMEKLEAAGGASETVLFLLARTYGSQGAYEKSIRIFRDLLGKQGEGDREGDFSLAIHIYLGQALAFQGRLEEAAAIFHASRQWSPKHPQLLFEAGKVEFLLGHRAQAERCFRAALELPVPVWTIPTDWDAIRAGARELLGRLTADAASLVSICTIVRDEEANVRELCAQLPRDRAEWVVVDTGSSDGTRRVLEEQGVKVHTFEWRDDFAAARNFSLALATRPWILWLDADDRLPADFCDRLRPHLTADAGVTPRAFRLVVESPRAEGGREIFRQTRLFPNRRGICFEGRVHEQVGSALERLGIPVEDLDLAITHLGYHDGEERRRKTARNFALLQEEHREHPDDPVVNMELGNALFQQERFAEALEVYRGYLGGHGFLAAGAARPADEAVRQFPLLVANTCRRLGDEAGAGQWYQKAAEWEPGGPEQNYWLGKFAAAAGRAAEAIARFEKVKQASIRAGRFPVDAGNLRRNALAHLVLLKTGEGRVLPDALEDLRELVRGGLADLPLEPQIPVSVFRRAEAWADLEDFHRRQLELEPGNLAAWENRLEVLMVMGRSGEVLALYDARPEIRMRSGVIEAFRGKCLEPVSDPLLRGAQNPAYQAYLQALHQFSGDPTLLVHFVDWVNRCRDFGRIYADLLLVPSPSAELQLLIGQLQARLREQGGA